LRSLATNKNEQGKLINCHPERSGRINRKNKTMRTGHWFSKKTIAGILSIISVYVLPADLNLGTVGCESL